MDDNTLLVVFSTRKQGDDLVETTEDITKTVGCNAFVNSVYNPSGASLTYVYNDALNKFPNYRYVVFMHDDVFPITIGWGRKILEMFKRNPEYGIIGIAGSKNYEKNGGWWQFKNIYGQVEHKSKDRGSWLTSFSPYFEHDLEEVCVIDGLFIAIDREKLTHLFSEDIPGFNFYDIDLCLANFRDKSCKIGVTTQIRFCHSSMGEVKPEWNQNHELVYEKYKDIIPIINLKENGEENQA